MRFLRLLRSPLVWSWPLVLVGSAAAEPAFRAGSFAWPVAAGASAVAAGDVNGDGYLDLAVACANADSVAVLLLGPGAQLTSQRHYATGTSPGAVVLGDVNRDGALDLIVANHNSDSITVLRGDGRGAFTNRRDFPTASAPDWIAAADLNLDGDIDLAVTCENDGAVSILWGESDGSFVRQADLPCGDVPSQVVAGDLNADGSLDLAVLHGGGVSFFLGAPGGVFEPGAKVTARAGAIALDDLNGDGALDLVAVGGAADVYPGAGDGTFRPRTRYDAGNSGPVSIAVGKIDGDSWPDLVIADHFSNRLNVLWGGPRGRFAASTGFSGGSGPRTPVVADLTGDGQPDIAVASGFALVSIFTATQERRFGNPLELEDPFGVAARALAAADLDADAVPDLLTLDVFGFLVTHTAKGDGTFRPATAIGVPSSQAPILLADFDADRLPDLVATLPQHAEEPTFIVWQRGEADGGFGPPLPVTFLDATAFAAGDLNHDGRLDLFILGSAGSTIALGQGDGRFEAASGPEAAGNAVALCDLDADGALDAVVAGSVDGASSGFLALRGHGDGTFEVAARRLLAASPSGVAVGDLDHDGELDVVTSDLDGHRIAVHHGFGGFAFDAPQFHATARAPVAVALADFDADGWLDVAAACAGSDVVTVLGGDGEGFPVRRDFGTRSHPNALAIADWNQDGLPDIATSNSTDGAVTVLLNTAHRTAAAIENLRADRTADGVRITWRYSAWAGARIESLDLQRSDLEAGPFTTIASWRAAAGIPGEAGDTGAPADAVFYRLIIGFDRGRIGMAGPIRAIRREASRPQLTLHAGQRGPGAVWRFRFETAGPALDLTAAIVDVRGRVVWSEPASRVAPGAHVFEWDPAATASRPAPARGVYFLRLSHPGGSRAVRFVLTTR